MVIQSPHAKIFSMDIHRGESGFALPTVVLSALIVLTVLSAGLSAAGSTRVALDEQYQAQITREAAEAGVAKANACVVQDGTAMWSTVKPLTPWSDCSGNPVAGLDCSASVPSNPECYVLKDGNIKTTYSITTPTTGQYGKLNYTVDAKINLTKTSSPNVVWKTLNTAVNYNSVMSAAPRVSGGAGWAADEHIALVATVDNQLYGFGDNTKNQINSTGSPKVTTPVKMDLPAGVASVKKIVTSGQGASYLCIIGDNQKAYCRGSVFSSSWTKIAYDGGTDYNAYDIVVNGWGSDNVCVMSGLDASSTQVYCAGDDDYGRLGIGTTGDVPFTGQYKKFILPGALTAKKMYSQNAHTCVIASNNDLYCGGANYSSQIDSTSALDEVYTPIKYRLPSMGTVTRKVVDVAPAYHQSPSTLLVLADDGTIWMSGERGTGMAGNGNITGDAPPDLFGEDSITGGLIRYTANKSYCIDNRGGSSSNGNKIQLYSCSAGSDAQEWFYTKGTQALWNPAVNKCIDLPNGIVGDWKPLQLWQCNGTDSQRWVSQGDGTYHSAIDSSYCIDLPYADPYDTNSIQLFTCNGGDAQKFTPDVGVQPWDGMITLGESACGIRSQFAPGVWCAGINNAGQLGIGTCSAIESYGAAMNLPVGRKIDMSKLSYEWRYQFGSLQIIADDGQVYGAGANTYGKLGNNNMSATQCGVVKMQLPAGVKAIDMSTRDEYSTYVLGDNGRVYATGRNNLGQLGDGTVINRALPVSVGFPMRGLVY